MRVLAKGVALPSNAKTTTDHREIPSSLNLNTATTDAAMNISGREFG
jgi:hypothetical protein